MNFSEILQLVSSNFWLYGGAFVVVLSLLVFVHEWGHYIVARLCGVKVETFSIGFGKELFGYTDKKGTRWKISLVPLGGYVKLFGDVDPASARNNESVVEDQSTHALRPMTAEERKMAFFAQPVAKRAAVVFAGPAINYIFAIIILAFLFMFEGRPVTPPVASAVIAGSAAEKSGFLPHDTVLEIDGTVVRDFDEIKREIMIGLDERKHFVVQRAGERVDIYAAPDRIALTDRFGFKHESGLLGLISVSHAVQIKDIVKVDGVAYETEDALRAALHERMGSTYRIEIKQPDENDVLVINPSAKFNESLSDPNAPEYGLLFIANRQARDTVKYPPLVAMEESLRQTWQVTVGTLKALGQIVMGTRSPTELGGVIRIGALAGDMAQEGLIAFAFFTALLSINLGLVNLLPIPLLDGGHLVFYSFEAVLKKPIPIKIQEYAYGAGMVFLVGIMAYANLNDLMQLIL